MAASVCVCGGGGSVLELWRLMHYYSSRGDSWCVFPCEVDDVGFG